MNIKSEGGQHNWVIIIFEHLRPGPANEEQNVKQIEETSDAHLDISARRGRNMQNANEKLLQ